jgi:UDP-N-acetyl-2-amino-2-deoxyglucuronate dehydrogenase
LINFALIGAAGYIAPRHMKAIKETENILTAALDPFDSVGIIDSYFPECDFFSEPERFDRHLDKLRRIGNGKQIDFVSICSPNYLHDAHIRLALRNQAHAICEKPLVLNPWNVEALIALENETQKNIYTILQLRYHPAILDLKKYVNEGSKEKIYDIKLTYITSRGNWYYRSWKGNIEKSGGIATNIGVHFFDMLTWIFGDVKENVVFEHNQSKASGFLKLSKANINWKLSIDSDDLPEQAKEKSQFTWRSITVDGKEIEFSGGFTDLHTVSYQNILSGKGYRPSDTLQSIQIVHDIRNFQTI